MSNQTLNNAPTQSSPGFSTEWDDIYKESNHMSIWPWTDLVTLVMRHARPRKPDFRVLEVGCGAGANIPFFKHLNIEYCAIEGSSAIVKVLHKNFPELENNIKAGDFTKELPFEGEFDLIIDRGSVTCNIVEDIERCFTLINDKLTPGGKFIGIDWLSKEHSDYQKGTQIDKNSYRDIENSHLSNLGIIHFAGKADMEMLLEPFNIKLLKHKTEQQELPNDSFKYASWDFVAEKK